MFRLSLCLVCVLIRCSFAALGQQPEFVTAITSLSDPAKLATLGDRQANPRLKKIVYWLDFARKQGRSPEQVIDTILIANGYTVQHAALIKTNLLRNLKIADELGFVTAENLQRLRSGHAPIVMTGPYAGEKADVDHIIPFAVAPEIGNELANLELMPHTLNEQKRAKIGMRQKSLAQQFFAAGVIDQNLLNRILSSY